MRAAKIDEFVGGWLVGNFEPNLIRSSDFEFAVKYYNSGDTEEAHHHKVATEITVIVEGEVIMFNKTWKTGDIIVIEPGESTSFKSISKSITAVIKSPSIIGDKYQD